MLLSLLLLLRTISPSVDTLTSAEWREDLHFMAAEIARLHRNVYHQVTRQQFDSAVADLDARIPTLSREQILTGFAKIVALVGDGHTHLPLPWDSAAGFGRYSVSLYRFADGFYVTGADPVYAQLVGGKVVSIAGQPVDQMFAAVTPLISRDPGNQMWYRLYAGNYMATPEILEALGLVAKGERATFVVQRDGSEVAAELARGVRPSATSQNGWVTGGGWVTMHDSLKAPGPLWTRRPDDTFWFQYLPSASALYVQYNAVQDGEKETVAHFFGRACAEVSRRHADRMVIDLRLNGGGDNTLNAEVIKTIMRTRPINRRGHLFVLIGRNTFSAAQNFVNSLERYTDAIFVGEPTGANPNQYGDAVPVRLRHSGVVLYVSTLWWQDLDPRDRRPWTAPEIAAEMTSADFRAGRDPALEAALQRRPEPALADRMLAALGQGDTARAFARYRAYRDDPRHVYVDTDRLLQKAARRAAEAGRLADALAVAQLNVREHPRSSAAEAYLAEGYARAGQKDLAIAGFERAIALDPTNSFALARLSALRGGS
jgi:hypothetical protein